MHTGVYLSICYTNNHYTLLLETALRHPCTEGASLYLRGVHPQARSLVAIVLKDVVGNLMLLRSGYGLESLAKLVTGSSHKLYVVRYM